MSNLVFISGGLLQTIATEFKKKLSNLLSLSFNSLMIDRFKYRAQGNRLNVRKFAANSLIENPRNWFLLSIYNRINGLCLAAMRD